MVPAHLLRQIGGWGSEVQKLRILTKEPLNFLDSRLLLLSGLELQALHAVEVHVLGIFFGADEPDTFMVVPLLAHFTLNHIILPLVRSPADAKGPTL